MLSCRFFKENLGKLDYEAVATHFDDYGLYCVNRKMGEFPFLYTHYCRLSLLASLVKENILTLLFLYTAAVLFCLVCDDSYINRLKRYKT